MEWSSPDTFILCTLNEENIKVSTVIWNNSIAWWLHASTENLNNFQLQLFISEAQAYNLFFY
jgi:hypothetical protein